MIERCPIALGIGGLVLAVLLAACEPRPQPPPAYYVEQACGQSGAAPGTAAYDQCVEDLRAKQLRDTYNMSIRGRSPGL